MPTSVPGRAEYSAYRLAGVTTLIATGQTPNLNDKVDFVQLPFTIFPPMFAFVFIQQDISLPATKPFKYEEIVTFPKDAKSILIQDADGVHSVSISEVDIPDFEISAHVDDGKKNYCVFTWIGINQFLIAKCDASVPAVYSRAFGPNTHAACEQFVKDNGGI